LQQRPQSPFDPTKVKPVAPKLVAEGKQLPAVIVFDLDNTLWTPELYTLRHLSGYQSASPPNPRPGIDVWLLDGAHAALHELASCKEWECTVIAAASRTNRGGWARALLAEIEVDGRSLDSLIMHKEIYTGDKKAHFSTIRAKTGIDYDQMLFFDDAADGKYGNCASVAGLGVLSAHCPDGLTNDVWRRALETYAALHAASEPKGKVLRVRRQGNPRSKEHRDVLPPKAGSVAAATPQTEQLVKVVKFLSDRDFGFVRVGTSDVYFHRSALRPASATLRVGSQVLVTLGRDSRARMECKSVQVVPNNAASTPDADTRRTAGSAATPASCGSKNQAGMVELPVFSMNMPFAGLVAHEHKTIESRNGTVFKGRRGVHLLHVGRRTYPDGGKHKVIMAKHGASAEQIERLTSLPSGFARGQLVAVVDIGETTLSTESERAQPDVERACVAYAADSGRYLTAVRRAEWLLQPVGPVPGRPGVFSAQVPVDCLPSWAKEAISTS